MDDTAWGIEAFITGSLFHTLVAVYLEQLSQSLSQLLEFRQGAMARFTPSLRSRWASKYPCSFRSIFSCSWLPWCPARLR